MKKKICILGSTGSIGKTTLEIISKNKKDFDVVLLREIIILNYSLHRQKNLNLNIFIQIIFILRRNLEFFAKLIISI